MEDGFAGILCRGLSQSLGFLDFTVIMFLARRSVIAGSMSALIDSACSARLLAAATDAGPSLQVESLPCVVLKLDDLAADSRGRVSSQWRRVADLALERGVRLAVGVVMETVARAENSYTDFISGLRNTGLVEFWLHGWDHRRWEKDGKLVSEFRGTSYDFQKHLFSRSQALARERLGFAFATFGASFNAYDGNTVQVFSEDPEMKVFLYGRTEDQARLNGKVVLRRHADVVIERPTGVPNLEGFVSAFRLHSAGQKYFVCQGHPGNWNETQFSEFVAIVGFLRENRIPTATATEAAARVLA